jgi:hypothetical protein
MRFRRNSKYYLGQFTAELNTPLPLVQEAVDKNLTEGYTNLSVITDVAVVPGYWPLCCISDVCSIEVMA